MTIIHNEFALKRLRELNYFLGIEVVRNTKEVFLNQSIYVSNLLQKIGMSESNLVVTPLSVSEKLFIEDSELFNDPTLYRSTIRALQYLMMTRPNLSFVVNKLSQFLKAPTQLQWQTCKRLLRYIKGFVHKGVLFRPT